VLGCWACTASPWAQSSSRGHAAGPRGPPPDTSPLTALRAPRTSPRAQGLQGAARSRVGCKVLTPQTLSWAGSAVVLGSVAVCGPSRTRSSPVRLEASGLRSLDVEFHVFGVCRLCGGVPHVSLGGSLGNKRCSGRLSTGTHLGSVGLGGAPACLLTTWDRACSRSLYLHACECAYACVYVRAACSAGRWRLHGHKEERA